jgi:hypothetical protein
MTVADPDRFNAKASCAIARTHEPAYMAARVREMAGAGVVGRGKEPSDVVHGGAVVQRRASDVVDRLFTVCPPATRLRVLGEARSSAPP